MVEGTSAFDGSRSSTVALETVVAFTDSLNVAVILTSAAMPVAPCAGNVEVTVELTVNIELRCKRDGLALQRRSKAGAETVGIDQECGEFLNLGITRSAGEIAQRVFPGCVGLELQVYT